ncbi:MAG: hypothetical protein K9L62_16480 [Vallitaleaceae bacterium]|nr:hypothetical protein [Vallitaleaceae bacterium]
MDDTIRGVITRILQKNEELLRIPIRQRAKFEGWLKFEIAHYLEMEGYNSVRVEYMFENQERADISFIHNEVQYYIELKTPNTNYRMEGIENKHRPITKNMSSIVTDAKKLKDKNGIVAFVLFPIAIGGTQWKTYIRRIAEEADTEITVEDNCMVIPMKVNDVDEVSLCVCCFMP